MKKRLIIAMIALSGAVYAQPQPGNIIGDWQFSSNLNDASGSANNGSWVGGSPSYVNDRCNNPSSAISLNGSQYVQCISPGPTGNNARSVSFWMRTSIASNTIPKAFFAYGRSNSGCAADAFEINYDYGCQGTGPDICTEQWTYGSTCLYDGAWHHVVATYDAGDNISQILMYVDGTLINTSCQGSGTSVLNTLNTVGVRIGCNAGATPGRHFTGSLDDFYLYNIALSQADVNALFAMKCNLTPCVSDDPDPDPDPKGCCLGNLCNAAAVNPLAGNYQIKLNKHDFFFTDDEDFRDKVNVGYNCGTPTIGKFNSTTHWLTNATPQPGMSPHSAAIYGYDDYNGSMVNNVGVMGEATNMERNSDVYGVWGKANRGSTAIGVRGTSEVPKQTGENFGGSFYAANSNVNDIGVSAIALPSNSTPPPLNYLFVPGGANIGLYAACTGTNPIDPNSVPGNDFAGWFDGDVNIVGNAFSTLGIWNSSDRRFKTNINEMTGVSEKLSRLKGYTYNFKADEFKNRNFPQREQIGFIAQELKEVFPQLVTTDREGYLAVNYAGFVPVLVQGYKEQSALIKAQQQQIDELKTMVASLAGQSPDAGKVGTATAIPVSLGDKNSIVLNQNVPNPFAESTVITYNLTSDFGKAQIIFSTNEGTVIKVIDIKEKGKGSLNVFADDLSHGVYRYTLIVDGKTIDTKQMIKE
jgi:hypothetical protein